MDGLAVHLIASYDWFKWGEVSKGEAKEKYPILPESSCLALTVTHLTNQPGGKLVGWRVHRNKFMAML